MTGISSCDASRDKSRLESDSASDPAPQTPFVVGHFDRRLLKLLPVITIWYFQTRCFHSWVKQAVGNTNVCACQPSLPLRNFVRSWLQVAVHYFAIKVICFLLLSFQSITGSVITWRANGVLVMAPQFTTNPFLVVVVTTLISCTS